MHGTLRLNDIISRSDLAPHRFLTKCIYTAQKTKFSIKHFFSKCDQICRKLRIYSHLLKISLMENFIFCAVLNVRLYSQNIIL